MSTLGSLAVNIIGDSRELDKTLDGITNKVQGFGRNLQKTGQDITRVGTGLTRNVTVPIMAAVGGLVAITTKAGNFADELLDLSAVTGVHTDQLQRWRYMAVDAGTDTDAVAEALSRMNRQMVEGTEFGARLEKTAESYGIALRDANGEVRQGTDVITDLMLAIADIEDPNERAIAGAQAFGRDWEAIAPIVDLGTEAIQKWNEQEVISQEQLERANEFRRSWDEMKHTLGLAAMEMGMELIPLMELIADVIKDRVVPFVQDLVERIGKLVEWFTNLSPETQKWVGILIGVAAAAGPVLIIVGTLVKAIGAILAVLSAKIIIIGLVIAAIVAFGVWIYNLITGNEELMERLTEIWNTIKEAAAEIWEAIVETFQHVKERIEEFWDEHGERIMEIATTAWNFIADAIETAITVISNIIQAILAVIRGDWEGAWEHLKTAGETAWNFIKDTATRIFESLRDALANIWENVKAKASEIWDNIKSAVVQKAQEIYTDAKKRLDDLWNYIKGIPRQALQWGRDILNNLWNGMRQVFANLQRWFRENVQDLLNRLNPFSRQSPSLIDNIWAGVREIERAYRSIRLPEYNISVAGGALAAVGAGAIENIDRSYTANQKVELHVGTLVADKQGLKQLERMLSEIRFGERERGAGK